MDAQVEKELNELVAKDPSYKEIEMRISSRLKKYDAPKYDKTGMSLLRLMYTAKTYGVEFVESAIESSMAAYHTLPQDMKLQMLPGHIINLLKGVQRVDAVVVYEGTVFSFKTKDDPTPKSSGKNVTIAIDDELYIVVVKGDKISMPFLAYHKYAMYGKFVAKNNEKFFYVNSELPIEDLGETDKKFDIEQMLSKGRPIVYQYSDLISLITRPTPTLFFLKAYVDRIEEKKSALSAYLVIPSGFDLPQDRPITVLVNNDIAVGDLLYIVATINQSNTWTDEIQLAAKIIIPSHASSGYTENTSAGIFSGHSNSSEDNTPPEDTTPPSLVHTDEKQSIQKETPKDTSVEPPKSPSQVKTPAEVMSDKKQPEKEKPKKDSATDTSEDSRIDAILKATMSEDESNDLF